MTTDTKMTSRRTTTTTTVTTKMASRKTTTTTTTSSSERSRPAFEKLLVGPLMCMGETATGGNYLEVLRLGKQMGIGPPGAGRSYGQLHTAFVAESGVVGAFYRGYFPWGLIQCAKGIPVLFVQHETKVHLEDNGVLTHKTAEKVGGFMGGAVQGVFVTPLQKLKVSVVMSTHFNSLPPMQACREVIKQEGMGGLFDGLGAMVLRRAMDWGIRFSVSSEAKHLLLEYKASQGQSPDLSAAEMIGCGVVGGAFSALSHPIDNVITQCQAPMEHGAKHDFVSVVKRIYQQSGTRGFTRGWSMKVLENSWHMAWMYGIGTFAYEFLHRELHRPREERFTLFPAKDEEKIKLTPQ